MPARVLLVPSACGVGAASGEAFVRQLRVELAGDGVANVEVLRADDPPSEPSLARVTVEPARCEADATVFVLGVDDAVTRKSVRREVDLGDVAPAGRPRALSIAAAELLRASWLELTMPTAPAPRAPVPEPVRDAVRVRVRAAQGEPPPDPARVAPRAPPSPWSVQIPVAAELRAVASGPLALYGARVGLTLGYALPGRALTLRMRVDGGAALGVSSTAWGQVELGAGTGALGLSLSRGGLIAFELGPRVEVGGAWVRGTQPVPGYTVGEGSAVVALLGLSAAVRGRFTPQVGGFVELDLAGAVAGLDARVRNGLETYSAGGLLGAVLSVRAGMNLELLSPQ